MFLAITFTVLTYLIFGQIKAPKNKRPGAVYLLYRCFGTYSNRNKAHFQTPIRR